MDIKEIIKQNEEKISQIKKINDSNKELLRLNVEEQDVFEHCKNEELKYLKLDYLKKAYKDINGMIETNKQNIVRFTKLNEILANPTKELEEYLLTFNEIVKFYKEVEDGKGNKQRNNN